MALAARGRAQTGERGVHGDAVQPGRETRLPAEVAEPLPRLDERVLQRLLGLGRIRMQPQADRVDPRVMAPVQPLERHHATVARTAHEVVVGRLEGHRVHDA